MGDTTARHILLIAGEDTILDYVRTIFNDNDITIKPDITSAQRILIGENAEIDCIIIDPTIRSQNPSTTVQQLQSIADNTPLVILTTLETFELAVNALNAGVSKFYTLNTPADIFCEGVTETIAYARKQQTDAILLGHLRNAIRGYQNNAISNASTSYPRALISGDLTLDRERYEATTPQQDILLSPTQFRILWMLIKSGGDTLTAHKIACEALGYEVSETEAKDLVKAHISRIRSKLSVVGKEKKLITVRGEGYKWVE